MRLSSGGGGGLPLFAHTNYVLSMTVRRKRTYHQVCCTVWTSYPRFLVVLECQACTRHPTLVSLLRLIPDCAAGVTEHNSRLPHIFLKTHPVKQPYKGVKGTLKKLRLVLCYQSVVCVEEGGSYLPPPPPPPPLSLGPTLPLPP